MYKKIKLRERILKINLQTLIEEVKAYKIHLVLQLASIVQRRSKENCYAII